MERGIRCHDIGVGVWPLGSNAIYNVITVIGVYSLLVYVTNTAEFRDYKT